MSEDERERLRALIEEHHGNQTKMAAALELPNREALRRKLEQHGLLADADVARARIGVRGPRPHLPADEQDAEDAVIIAALTAYKSYRLAAKALDLSPRTMMRKIQRMRARQRAKQRARKKR